jgi:hypothetical protein
VLATIVIVVGEMRAKPIGSVAPDVSSSRAAPPGASPTPSPSPTPSRSPTPSGPKLLLPNLRSLPASDLSIEQAGNQRRLRFAASLANRGPGPLVLLPRGRGDCDADQHSAVQVLHVDRNSDGRFQRSRDTPTQRRFSGCMLEHPGHDHWHFDAMAAYRLRLPGSTRSLVARDKVSFCLRDNVRVRDLRASAPRRYFGECSRNTHQGISPGWVDVYESDLPGQWLRIPAAVEDGAVVCLDLQADPDDLVVETDETDNATSVPIRIDGRDVDRVRSDACS